MGWLWRVGERAARDREVDRELRFHVEQQTDENIAAGMTPAEARRHALASLGGLGPVREECRAVWSGGLLDDLRLDVLGAVRAIWRHPGVTLLAMVIVAAGVGPSLTVFSVVDSVLLRPLPYPEPDRLVMVWDTHPDIAQPRVGPTPGNLIDWRRETTAFSGMAAWYAGDLVTLQDAGEPEKVQRTDVTSDFFAVLGRAPMLGRTFRPEEVESEDPVVVLSHGLWQRRFNGDPTIVGRRLRLDGVGHEVVGVMPDDFALPTRDAGVYLPWDFERRYADLSVVPRDYRFLRVVARLAPGWTRPQAQSDLDRVTEVLAGLYPTTNQGWASRLVPLSTELTGNLRPALLTATGAVFFVLLIAGVNAANLLLARASDRRREMSVRSALGASERRLVRQLLTESSVLALGGGILGLLMAWAALDLLVALAPDLVTRAATVTVDGRVVAFGLGLSILTGVVFGLVPALYVRSGPGESFVRTARDSVHRTAPHGLRRGLVVVQFAAAIMLLVGAGLLVRSFERVLAVEPGFDAERALVLRVFPDADAYDTAEKRLTYFDRLEERLGALPGVEAVGASTGLPLNTFNNTPLVPYWADGAPRPVSGGPEAEVAMVTTGFFEAMGIPLRQGRWFDATDHTDAPRVVIVNQALAREVWSGAAVGRRLVLDYGRQGPYPYEVVGVVGDIRATALKQSPAPQLFMPHAQVPYVTMHVVVRTTAEPSTLIPAARQVVLAEDPTQPVHSLTTLGALVSTARNPDRFAAVVLSSLAVLAVGLATAGIYGLLSHSVSGRRREFGVRMALGASPGQVMTLVLGQGGGIVAIGVAVGLGAALVLTRALDALLYEVRPLDLMTFTAVPLVLAAVALAASYIPARRAALADPMTALRTD